MVFMDIDMPEQDGIETAQEMICIHRNQVMIRRDFLSMNCSKESMPRFDSLVVAGLVYERKKESMLQCG